MEDVKKEAQKGCSICKAIIKDPNQFKAKEMEKTQFYIGDDED